MSTITHCAIHGTHSLPQAPSRLCRRCENNLRDWLREIPERFALLPAFLEHGTTDHNPDSKATKKAEAPPPMRLAIVDLLDRRLGRKWQGLDVTDDRRGAYGTLHAICANIKDARDLTGPIPNTVAGTCDYIARHMLWLAEQDWVNEPFNEVRILHREVSDGVGIFRPKPVGSCHLIPDDTETPCGGPLFANPYGGVRCARCQATWDAAKLRMLGLAQAEAQEPA